MAYIRFYKETTLAWLIFLFINHHYVRSCHSWLLPSSHHAWVDDASVVATETLALSLTSPRAWLESLPCGAYTVMRCDHVVGSSRSWKIWGRDFHIQRLEDSIRVENDITCENINTTRAIQQTDEMIQTLLSCYEHQLVNATANQNYNRELRCDSYMLTILWCLNQDSKTRICVKGHITSYQITAWNPKKYNPHPIKAILAYNAIDQSSLSSRNTHPNAKLSSWCHARRPLEARFKIPFQTDEVFLIENDDGGAGDSATEQFGSCSTTSVTAAPSIANARILEGLTSNVFTVHRNGTLYTAPDHCVLGGYARQLVMESATRLGMKVVSSQPIRVADSELWTEVFITSSIKLITPVGTVVAPWVTTTDETHKDGCTVLWSRNEAETTVHQCVWESIYMDILSHHLRE